LNFKSSYCSFFSKIKYWVQQRIAGSPRNSKEHRKKGTAKQLQAAWGGEVIQSSGQPWPE
jgi:hypothetical protein